MKVLLTGGSGNLGHTLVPRLLDEGNTPIILDIRAPLHLQKGAVFIEGSILDRPKLTEIFRGCDCIVHIAAWHGIHEDRGEKNPHDFFDLNVAAVPWFSFQREIVDRAVLSLKDAAVPSFLIEFLFTR